MLKRPVANLLLEVNPNGVHAGEPDGDIVVAFLSHLVKQARNFLAALFYERCNRRENQKDKYIYIYI